MGKVYNAQDALRIRLTCSQNITGASVKQIKYKKPGGTTGAWDAQVEDFMTGIIYYDLMAGNINESGLWSFWAYITFSDGRSAPGEPISKFMYPEGQ